MAIGSMTTNSTVDMIDKTLKTENAPADAKAVGDIILDFTKETPQPIFYSKAEVDKLLEDCKEAAKRAALLAANPVGKLWASDDPTSPASIVGGTWERIKDRFILAAGDTYAAGSAGGSVTHQHVYTVHYNAKYGMLVNADESWSLSSMLYNESNQLSMNQSVKTIFDGNGATINQNFLIAATESNRTTSYNATGSTSYQSNLPPYQVFYVWQRVA